MGSNSDLAAIGKRIAEQRQKNNLTQAELAKRVSVSREIINYWENGNRDIKTGNIVLLAEALNTTCDYLLGLSEAPTTDTDLKAVCDYTGLSQGAITRILNATEEEKLRDPDFHQRGMLSKILESPYFWSIYKTISHSLLYRDTLVPNREIALEAAKEMIDEDNFDGTHKILLYASIKGLAPLYKHEIAEDAKRLFTQITRYREIMGKVNQQPEDANEKHEST